MNQETRPVQLKKDTITLVKKLRDFMNKNQRSKSTMDSVIYVALLKEAKILQVEVHT